MTRLLRLVACCVLMAALAGLASAEEGLLFELKETRVEQRDKTVGPDREKQEPFETVKTYRVILAAKRTWVADDDSFMLWDFAEERIFDRNATKKTMTEHSLYTIAGYREAEFRNQVYISQVLNKLEGELRVDHAGLESLFGALMNPPAVTQCGVTENEDGSVSLDLDGTPHVNVVWSSELVPEGLRIAYVRHLAHNTQIHPLARAKLVENGTLPTSIEYQYEQVQGKVRVKLEWLAVTPASIPDAEPVEGYTREWSSNASLNEVLASTHAALDSAPAPSFGAYAEVAEKMISEERHLDAVLTAMEGSLSVTDRDQVVLGRIFQAAADDPGVQTFLYAVNTGNSEPDKALEALASIDATALEKAYVLDIFRATNHANKGESGKALELYMGVLAVNPFVTGVWKDIGDVHRKGYDAWSAWACWDVARRIAPGHMMLTDVDARETWLRTQFPDLF